MMGSKNLKAIVTRGTGTLKIAQPDAFRNLVAQRKDAGDWVTGPGQAWGRIPLTSPHIRQEMEAKYLKKFTGCYGCPYQCHGLYDIPGVGRGAQLCTDVWYGYTTKSAWGGSLLAQRMGVNTFELVGLMLFLNQGVRRGFLKKEDIGSSWFEVLALPRESAYRDHEVHHRFVDDLVNGIADGTSIFSQGVARAAEQLGPEAVDLYHAIFPGWGNRFHHIRGVAEALHWATDTRDPVNSAHDHISFGNYGAIADWFGVPGGYLKGEAERKHRNVYQGTERGVVWVQNHQCLKNSLLICEWASQPPLFFHPPEMDIRVFETRALAAVTGLELDPDELWRTGERIWNLRRAIMVLREDRHRDGDTLSQDLFGKNEAGRFPEGLSGPLDKGKWEALKDRYYQLRGWDVGTGRPTRAKLQELGMKDVADVLENAGRLG